MPKTTAKPAKKSALSKEARERIVAKCKERWAKVGKKNADPKQPSASAGTGTKPARSEVMNVLPGQIEYRTEDTSLPLAQLRPGDNYATREEDEKFLELLESVKLHGIRQRLWVRPLAKQNGKVTHEIIAGERRFMAANKLNLLTVPVTIYHITDDEAFALNLIENLQRDDADEVDEALGIKRMQDRGFSAWDEKNPQRSIGHILGIAKTQVYGALKLCELSKTGLDAVRAGEIAASVGTRIARIPNKEARAEALSDAIRNRWTDEDAASEIARHYMTELKGAPFDQKDASLCKGCPDCVSCPKRSGNQAEMFADMAKGRGDICTDPTCYREKCEASFQKRAAAHEDAGGKVLSKKQAEDAGLHKNYSSIGGKWTDLDSSCYFIPHTAPAYGKKVRDVLKEELKADSTLLTLALANDGSGKHYEIIEKETVVKLLKASGKFTKKKGGGEEDESEANDNAAQQREAKAAKKRDKAIVQTILGQVAIEAEAFARAADFTLLQSQLIHAQIRSLIAGHGPDALRPVVERRGIDAKTFKLEEGDDTICGRFQRGLRAELEKMDTVVAVGLWAELMLTPQYTPDEGNLFREDWDDDRWKPLVTTLAIEPKACYRVCASSVPGGPELLAWREEINKLTDRIVEHLKTVKGGKLSGKQLKKALGIDEKTLRAWCRENANREDGPLSASYWGEWVALGQVDDPGDLPDAEDAEEEGEDQD